MRPSSYLAVVLIRRENDKRQIVLRRKKEGKTVDFEHTEGIENVYVLTSKGIHLILIE